MKEIKDLMNTLAAKVGMPEKYLPTFGYSEDFGRPHIEKEGNTYKYLVVERGETRETRVTENIQDLMYMIFESATAEMAWDFERINRKDGQDSRRLAFSKQLELLSAIDANFALKFNEKLRAILRIAPYVDEH